MGMIMSLLQLGHLDRVVDLLTDKAIGSQLDEELSRILLVALVRTGNLERLPSCFAATYRRKVIPVNPGEVGAALAALGKPQAGLQYLEMWLKSNPADRQVVVQYARTVAHSGLFPKTEAALKQLDDVAGAATPAPYLAYQLARYYPLDGDLAWLETDEDPEVWHERVSMHPGMTDLSRLEYRSDAGSRHDRHFASLEISPQGLRAGIDAVRALVRTLREAGRFDVQLRNIAAAKARFGANARDPVQVLSTGRCGTRSLFGLCLLSKRVLPYHSFELATLPVDRNHLLYRIATGRLDKESVAALAVHYLQTRTAEFIYAYRTGRTPLVTSHWDAIFAPFVAEMFPEARFLYLRREETAVFRSIYGKNQWQDSQLMPLSFDPRFPAGRFVCRHEVGLDIEMRIAWYLHVTGVFAEAFLDGIEADRQLSLRSEALFAGTPETLKDLRNVLPLDDIDADALAAHFNAPQNTKDTVLQVAKQDLDCRAAHIPQLLECLARDGRYRGEAIEGMT